jgi:hypothetical protein
MNLRTVAAALLPASPAMAQSEQRQLDADVYQELIEHDQQQKALESPEHQEIERDRREWEKRILDSLFPPDADTARILGPDLYRRR